MRLGCDSGNRPGVSASEPPVEFVGRPGILNAICYRECPMTALFRFPTTAKKDPAIETWMYEPWDALGVFARHWFEIMRNCGEDVRELLHDGHPTACVGDAAFAYVDAFKAHVNVGFFRGAELADPGGLLEGNGKLMRHVKL